ncbi:MAG: ABC transporter substrate-binding protein [Dehalococcoidia bacterium]
MSKLRIMASRHSAFYSPLISTIAGGFLKEEGFEGVYSVAGGTPLPQLINDGEIDVAQSAVGGSWGPMEKGEKPPTVHFAQINTRDGFLIASRKPDPDFTWDKLTTGKFMFVHGGQPQAMLAYGLHKKGVDINDLDPIDAGGTEDMMSGFRSGQGDFFHEQGPYPQQLEHEGHAQVVASVGEAVGPVAFSSLTASWDWVKTPEAARFTRAYRKSREWVNTAPPAEVAEAEKDFFPEYSLEALTKTLEYYQGLGCWDGDIAIPQNLYEAALDVFEHSKLITKRYPMDQVVVAPPDA